MSSNVPLEQVADVDETLGEQFLSDVDPTQEGLMVRLAQFGVFIILVILYQMHTGGHSQSSDQEEIHTCVYGFCLKEQRLPGLSL